MADSPPSPPNELPTEIVGTLDDYSPKLLQQVAAYAGALVEYREEQDRSEAATTESDHRDEDIPEDIPSKATLTIKEINDNRYYYWQWREGDEIKSKYKEPVTKSQ